MQAYKHMPGGSSSHIRLLRNATLELHKVPRPKIQWRRGDPCASHSASKIESPAYESWLMTTQGFLSSLLAPVRSEENHFVLFFFHSPFMRSSYKTSDTGAVTYEWAVTSCFGHDCDPSGQFLAGLNQFEMGFSRWIGKKNSDVSDSRDTGRRWTNGEKNWQHKY